MEASIFNMTMTDQILRQENEQTRKHDENKAHQRIEQDAVELEVTQQTAHAEKKQKNQRTLLSKRLKVAQALNKKQASEAKLAQTRNVTKESLKRARNEQLVKNQAQEKTQKTATPKEAFENLKPAAQEMIRQFGYRVMDTHLKFFRPEIEDADFIPKEEDLPEAFQSKETSKENEAEKAQVKSKNLSSNATKEQVSKLTPAEKQAYLTKILSGNGKDILDTLLDPKYLVGCTLTEQELKALKQKVSKRARLIRKISVHSMPMAVASLRRAGLGHELGSWGNQFPSSSNDKNENANSAIFEALAESLELTGLLQKLGIQTDILETTCQAATATEELAEAKTQATDNMNDLHDNLNRSACQQIIQIFSYVAAFILIAIGQPEAGILMIASASGLLQMVLEKLADAMGISQLGLKSLIMAITIIIAIVSANPAVMGEDAISALSAFGNTMLVAGSIGFVQDFLGFCATGQNDPSQFPSWVAWAALGINIAASLPDIVIGGYQLIAKGMAKLAGRAADAAAASAAAAEAAAATAKAASNAAEEAGNSAVRAARAINGEAERDVEEAVNAVERGANGRAGQALEDGADTAAQASRLARSTVRPAQAAAGEATTIIATTAPAEGEAAVQNAASRAPEVRTSGAGERATVEGTSRANQLAEENAVFDGEAEANNTAAAIASSSTAQGEETYAAAEKEVGETLKEAKEGDPFKAKLRKMMDVFKRAEQELDRLSALEERAASAGETAGEVSAQFRKAQEEVERLEAEVARLRERVNSQEEAVAKFTRQFEEIKALRVAKMQELATLEENAVENAEAITQLKGEIAEVEQKMSKLSQEVKALDQSQKELSLAEDKLAAAKNRLAKWKNRIDTDEGKSIKSKFAKIKAFLKTNFGKVGKALLMTDTVGQAYAEYKLAEIDLDIGRLLAEIAEATGNFELLGTFYEIFGTLEADTKQRNEQYAQDMHDEIKLVGDIINAERRASNILMSA